MVTRLLNRLGRRLRGEVWYARRLGVDVGQGCRLFRIVYGSEPWLIRIGDRVQITDGVRLLTHGGGWLARDDNPSFDSFGRVEIGSRTYIGNAAIILPGVTIGERSIVAAGSVVTKSVPANSVVGGNPARIICSVDDYLLRNAVYDVGTAGMSADEKRRVVERSPERLIRRSYLRP